MVMKTSHSPQRRLPPGPKGLPFVGSLFPFQFSPLRFFRALQREYGDLVMITLANRRVLFCFGPEQVRHVMVDAADLLIRPHLKGPSPGRYTNLPKRQKRKRSS